MNAPRIMEPNEPIGERIDFLTGPNPGPTDFSKPDVILRRTPVCEADSPTGFTTFTTP